VPFSNSLIRDSVFSTLNLGESNVPSSLNKSHQESSDRDQSNSRSRYHFEVGVKKGEADNNLHGITPTGLSPDMTRSDWEAINRVPKLPKAKENEVRASSMLEVSLKEEEESNNYTSV